jgi:hypothetical protein
MSKINHKEELVSFFSYYSLSSLFVSLFFPAHFLLTEGAHSSFLSSFPFMATFVGINLVFVFSGMILVGRHAKVAIQSYTLAQIALLVMTSLNQSDVTYLYFSLLPCCAGMVAISAKSEKSSEKFLLLPLIGTCLYLATGSIHGSWHSGDDLMMFGTFSFWATGTFFWIYNSAKKEHRFVLGQVLRRKKGHSKSNADQDERLFFHDVINHTHSLNLFLGLRVADGAGLSAQECLEVEREVKLLQSLVSKHFSYDHRNITAVYEFVEFDFAAKGVQYLIDSFLPANKVTTHVTYRSELCDIEAHWNCHVEYHSFYRIMNNLIKNASDYHSPEVEISFDLTDELLSIELKSRLLNLKNIKENLNQRLESIISGEGDKTQTLIQGVGLESVVSLTDKMGGQSTFFVDGDYWVSKIELPVKRVPNRSSEQDIKQAA